MTGIVPMAPENQAICLPRRAKLSERRFPSAVVSFIEVRARRQWFACAVAALLNSVYCR
tara:strand:- start:456 stop:632 length:177 start_codon:yes stop_codon:yes gene_type:complete